LRNKKFSFLSKEMAEIKEKDQSEPSSSRPETPTGRKRTRPDPNFPIGLDLNPLGRNIPMPSPETPRITVPNDDSRADPLSLAKFRFQEFRELSERALGLVRQLEEYKEATLKVEDRLRSLEGHSPELKALISSAKHFFAKKRRVAPRAATRQAAGSQIEPLTLPPSLSNLSFSQTSKSETKKSKSKKKREKKKKKAEDPVSIAEKTAKATNPTPGELAIRTHEMNDQVEPDADI
jgi:hypothetical protein